MAAVACWWCCAGLEDSSCLKEQAAPDLQPSRIGKKEQVSVYETGWGAKCDIGGGQVTLDAPTTMQPQQMRGTGSRRIVDEKVITG